MGQPAQCANQPSERKQTTGDHTPGPWRWTTEFRTRDNNQTESLIGHEGYGIMSCDGLVNSPNRANAHLIAAAPDMLAVLKNIWLRCEVRGDDDEREIRRQMLHINTMARAAIAKAEGK